MSETVSKEMLLLLAEYANSGDFGRNELEKKNPHINFRELIKDADLVRKAKEARLADSAAKARNIGASVSSQVGNIWIGILALVSWIFFVIAVIGGIYSALFLYEIFGGGVAFVIFLISTATAFIILAVIMVFLTMAKDISRTAKDTAEIKEILKNK
ncbi:MAG: hypothetical protein LBE55_04085 [Clostridiales bacterium]|jgi:uncharacterized membrane protein|nr:hypothetical protein [Clostridiales bacterium]